MDPDWQEAVVHCAGAAGFADKSAYALAVGPGMDERLAWLKAIS